MEVLDLQSFYKALKLFLNLQAFFEPASLFQAFFKLQSIFNSFFSPYFPDAVPATLVVAVVHSN